MAITDKLNDAWTTNEAVDAIVSAHSEMQKLQDTVQEVKAELDRLAAGAHFADVDAELKTEAQACRTLVNQMISALAEHSSFIDWVQPANGE